MKHTITVTLALILFFILSQFVGLFLISYDANIVTEQKDGQSVITVKHSDTSLGGRPETTGLGSYLYIVIGIGIGTLLVLVLAKFNSVKIWRVWFLVAVWLALSVSIGAIIYSNIIFEYDIALILALILGLWKVFKPNIFIHNITEVLMYAGIALLLVPLFNVLWVIILLLTISVYDMYAVWKSKHMVTMAKFQTRSDVFAGLMIRYKPSGNPVPKKARTSTSGKAKTAILGGGDVVFPLMLSGVVMEHLMTQGLTKSAAFLEASIIVATTTIALALLFFMAKKDRFYPAMPFITAGCLVGWVIVLLL
jgi:presenilin-like A22 family membrane protease